MYHFEKKNSKNFSPDGPRENVWGPCENVFPGPAVALDGPALSYFTGQLRNPWQMLTEPRLKITGLSFCGE